MKLLHIVAAPRAHESRTLRVSKAFIESMHAKYADLVVDEINVFQGDLPAVAGDNIETRYTLMFGTPIDKRHKESWAQIEALIQHFLTADVYLISTPMWNFSIPYALKFYIDAIMQPGYLFKYNEKGQAIGLVQGRKMVCVTSRGGDYSEGSPFRSYDFQEPYLRAIFGFVGITDMHFVSAQPMDVTLEMREAALKGAIERAQQLVGQSEWGPLKAAVNVQNPAELKPRTI